MSRFADGLIVWGLWAGLFVVLEFAPILWKGCPWPTLSSTVKGLEGRDVWIAFVVFVGLVVLTIHLTGAFISKFWHTVT